MLNHNENRAEKKSITSWKEVGSNQYSCQKIEFDTLASLLTTKVSNESGKKKKKKCLIYFESEWNILLLWEKIFFKYLFFFFVKFIHITIFYSFTTKYVKIHSAPHLILENLRWSEHYQKIIYFS